jgi:hypothetical protein
MVLTVSFALSSVTGLVCHRRLRKSSRKLDASVGASEPHDFAVRISSVRQGSQSVHRIPHPTLMTMANAPLGEHRMGESVVLICPTAPAEYFSLADWTASITLIAANKSRFSRGWFWQRWPR